MKRWFLSLTALFLFGLFLFPGTAGAVRVDDPQRLAVGRAVSFAIDDEGGLWAWGNNYHGALGQTYTTSGTGDDNFYHRYRYTPTKILDDVIWVACGENFGAAIKSDHTLWMWGDNTVGQLGNGGRSNRSYDSGDRLNNFYRYQDAPIQVMGDVAAISCHGQSAAVIKLDGSLWGWGDVTSGGLAGNIDLFNYHSKQERYQTTPVKLMENVDKVYTAGVAAAAIKTDSSLWVWGGATAGALGISQAEPESDRIYQPLKLLDNVSHLALSDQALALDQSGVLRAWGHSPLKKIYDPANGLIGEDVQSSDEDWQSPVVIPAALLDLSGQAAPPEEDLPPDDPGAPEIVTAGVDPQEAGVAQSVRQPLELRDERAELAGYALSDGAGGSTTYVRLRDLGQALGFNVGWSVRRGMYVEPGRPYSDED